MKHPLDLAPKEHQNTRTAEREAFRLGAERLAAAMPVGVLVRYQRGKVALINSVARRALRVEQIETAAMSLTIIRRGVESNPAQNVYLLSADQEPLVRLVAEPIRVDLGDIEPLELLVLEPEGAGEADSKPEPQAATAPSPRGSRRAARPSVGTIFTPRDLVACAARRLRRHSKGALTIRLGNAPTRRCDRKVEIDEIAFAEVLLSSAEWMTTGIDAASLLLTAQVAGHRLRISIDGPPLGAPNAPETDRDWMRTVRPFLDAHRATFEIHDDEHHRRIVISLPLCR